MLTCFTPGAIWPDNNGVHINAHGGGVLHHDGVYYWFGEHKIAGTAGNLAHVGVHCYSSRDLYNWRDEGIALPVSDDPAHDLRKGCVIERPKVIFNAKTRQFVMWYHYENDTAYSLARCGIAVADKPTGPYRFIRTARPDTGAWPINVRPDQKDPASIEAAKAAGDFSNGNNPKTAQFNVLGRDVSAGQQSRDMTVFVDDDGAAYHLYSSEHNSTLHIARLTDDYLDWSGQYSRCFEHRWMEGPAICKHAGRYYLVASDCTGWAPNAARAAVADSIFGPWRETGNPCVGVNPQNNLGPEKTFGGQSTYILPVAGSPGAFIGLFDIWNPDNAIDGRYCWLPLEITDAGMRVQWHTTWDLSVFQK